jgi:hypothetical protein
VIVRRLSVVALVVASLTAGSALSASAATSPDKWASNFCTALGKWQKTITSESGKANAALDVQSGSDLSAIRAEFVSFLKADVAATKAAIDKIDKGGAPDITNGAKIQKKVIAGLQSTSDVFLGAQQDAAALSTTDPAAFVSDATTVQTNLSSGAEGFTNAITQAQALDKDNKIGAAFNKAKACKALG